MLVKCIRPTNSFYRGRTYKINIVGKAGPDQMLEMVYDDDGYTDTARAKHFVKAPPNIGKIYEENL